MRNSDAHPAGSTATEAPRVVFDRMILWLVALGVGLWTLNTYGRGIGYGDYELELRPTVDALVAGDLHRAFSGPLVYVGSLTVRWPILAMGSAFGLSDEGLYVLGNAASLAAAAGVAVALIGGSGRSLLGRAAMVALLLGAPVLGSAFGYGHPEDVLATAALTGSVVLAVRRRPVWAGVLLGAACAIKPWAVVGLVLVLVLVDGGRVRALLGAVGAGLVLVAPVLVVGGSSELVAATGGAARAMGEFHPQQLFWFLGHRNDVPTTNVVGTAVEGGRHEPAWLVPITHPLVVVAAAGATCIWARRGRRDESEALLILALVLLIRGALDTWNSAYYAMPMVFVLTIWEARHRRGIPIVSLATSAACTLLFQLLPIVLPLDAVAAAYSVCAVALAVTVVRHIVGHAEERAAHRTIEHAPHHHRTAPAHGGCEAAPGPT